MFVCLCVVFVQVESLVRGGTDRKLTMTEASLCSLAGGSLSALSTIPFDVLVATFQSAGKAGQVRSTSASAASLDPIVADCRHSVTRGCMSLLSLQKVSIADTYKELSSKGLGNVVAFSTRGYR